MGWMVRAPDLLQPVEYYTTNVVSWTGGVLTVQSPLDGSNLVINNVMSQTPTAGAPVIVLGTGTTGDACIAMYPPAEAGWIGGGNFDYGGISNPDSAGNWYALLGTRASSGGATGYILTQFSSAGMATWSVQITAPTNATAASNYINCPAPPVVGPSGNVIIDAFFGGGVSSTDVRMYSTAGGYVTASGISAGANPTTGIICAYTSAGVPIWNQGYAMKASFGTTPGTGSPVGLATDGTSVAFAINGAYFSSTNAILQLGGAGTSYTVANSTYTAGFAVVTLNASTGAVVAVAVPGSSTTAGSFVVRGSVAMDGAGNVTTIVGGYGGNLFISGVSTFASLPAGGLFIWLSFIASTGYANGSVKSTAPSTTGPNSSFACVDSSGNYFLNFNLASIGTYGWYSGTPTITTVATNTLVIFAIPAGGGTTGGAVVAVPSITTSVMVALPSGDVAIGGHASTSTTWGSTVLPAPYSGGFEAVIGQVTVSSGTIQWAIGLGCPTQAQAAYVRGLSANPDGSLNYMVNKTIEVTATPTTTLPTWTPSGPAPVNSVGYTGRLGMGGSWT